ncbi:hypothetical protein KLA_14318 [Cellulophaga geojensis KL-A]|uniref:Lipoprotein n=1 Tax=Cellulophaga geojensis KL-A TaxID=1328323 RepID=A0ABN0RL09_9FLAO|nr:hypothetical protein [Cellulophaga geojensis]EWH12567.1 hypothetical protein KLA_14318 [Cellulophaga geojensis KL-A]
MYRLLNLFLISLLIFGCSNRKKGSQNDISNSIFIDSTDFKFFGLEEFNLEEWYEGKVKLKSLTKIQAEKYYQYRLRNGLVDTNYYQFYSIQKNTNQQKIITIVDGVTGRYPDLRMLIYNKRDSLIGFYPIAGIGNDPDINLKYKLVSKKLNDTRYLSTRIDEYEVESNLENIQRDSTVTKFELELGYMKEAKILDKKTYKLE